MEGIYEEYGRYFSKLLKIFESGDLTEYEETKDEETAILLGTYYLINGEKERAEMFYGKVNDRDLKQQISMISSFFITLKNTSR